MTNTLYRFSDDHLTIDSKPVAIPMDESLTFPEHLIFAVLIHWLENETHARVLTPQIARMFPKKLGKSDWLISQAELEEAVILAFVKAKMHLDHPVIVEYVAGQRRDILRDIAEGRLTGADAKRAQEWLDGLPI